MDAAPQPAGKSLVQRLAAALARAGGREWWVAAGVAGLIAAGPLATLLGAKLLAGGARAEAQRLAAEAAPGTKAREAAARERGELAALVRRPALGATLEAFARALPPEARLARAGRGAGGRLEADVAAPDPDQLRSALRGEASLAALRDAGQRREETMMIVSLREPAR